MVRNFTIKIFLLHIFLSPTLFNFFAQQKTSLEITNDDGSALIRQIKTTAELIITTLNIWYSSNEKTSLQTSEVTEKAKSNINSLYQTAPFYCPEPSLKIGFLRVGRTNFELRGIPIKVKDQDSLVDEEGVLLFNRDGHLEDFYFGLESHQYKKLLEGGKNVSDLRRRQIILDFVENFRTAYNRKDISYIESVFSDHALIIVGRIIKEKEDQNKYLERAFSPEKVELIKYNKKDYVSHLKNSFQTNSYIKVDFERIEIMQHREFSELYGVTLIQSWKASRYSDKGFLFLLIDFKDEANPTVHVRAWQPEDFTKVEDIITLGDFEIIK